MAYTGPEDDNNRYAWISHRFADPALQLTPSSWVDTPRVVARFQTPLVTLRRPVEI